MKSKTFFLNLVLLLAIFGCAVFEPKKAYFGPEQPRNHLALIRQTDDSVSRVIYVMLPHEGGLTKTQIDSLGVTVLPGTYTFKADLYPWHYVKSNRISEGPYDFGYETVYERVRDAKPYKRAADISLTVDAGVKYGITCDDNGRIHIKAIGSYK